MKTGRGERCRVVGLTSAARAPFVRSTGYHDDVVAYDDVGSLPSGVDAVCVDFAGRPTVRAAVHAQLGDRLRHCSTVGTTHRERLAAPAETPPGS